MLFVSFDRYVAPIKSFCKKDWFPSFALLVVMMLTLISAMFSFMLMPGLNPRSDISGTAHNSLNAPEKATDNGEAGHGPGNGNSYALPELVTNVGDSSGRRFVVANLTLVGANKSFFAENEAKIMDLSSGILARIKPDVLEKPSNRTMIKTELLAEMQRVLGGSYVKDIYFTRLAIQ